ncbi:PREDICTED: uncharacterized protein LOC101306305 [Fragaria vesca subsp. vesca]
MNDESSDDEYEEIVLALVEKSIKEDTPRRRGSIKGRISIQRDRSDAHDRLYADYFRDQPVFPSHIFRQRFRMKRPLFLRIHNAVVNHDSYFVQKRNAAGVLGLSSLQKITAALRMIAYGTSADQVDEYLQIGESIAIVSLKRFVKAVVEIFGDEYLRSPNNDDIVRLLAIGEQRGFRGMLGSIDCMHWKWKNCPKAWHGMYSGHIHEPTIILEAVASNDLWIWHAFFGLPGSHNDINVLEQSSVFAKLAEGHAPEVKYKIMDNEYNMGYYLADGIYPQWATFVKTIPAPQGRKHKHIADLQEGYRKDVERAFGVLQARFAIIRGPVRFWNQEDLANIMTACVIMHNMIIEDERKDNRNIHQLHKDYDNVPRGPPIPSVSREPTSSFMEFLANHDRIRDRQTHSQLQKDLIEHLWKLHGDYDNN